MLKEFVGKLEDMMTPVLIPVLNRQYSSKPLYAVTDPFAETLRVSTLTAIADYLRENRDKLDSSSLMLQIVSHSVVVLISTLHSPWRNREILMTASLDNHGKQFEFDRYMDAESFVTQLQSRFVKTEQIDKILQIVGNMKAEKSFTSTDDGITQSVVSRAGVALASMVEIPNPVVLAPYRTFTEVDQPSSAFILRVKNMREGEAPHIGLFEADGGRWKLDAIQRIRLFLEVATKGIAIIG